MLTFKERNKFLFINLVKTSNRQRIAFGAQNWHISRDSLPEDLVLMQSVIFLIPIHHLVPIFLVNFVPKIKTASYLKLPRARIAQNI